MKAKPEYEAQAMSDYTQARAIGSTFTTFDLQGLYPELMIGDRLKLELPVFAFEGPVFSEPMLEVLKDSGMSGGEIDQIIDEVVFKVQARWLASQLICRRIK
jgi:hypothetical protein